MTQRDITTVNTLTVLYEAFGKLNKYYFNNELPTVIILITDTERRYAYGWFTVNTMWTDDRDNHTMHEISLSAHALKKGSHFMIGVLLHEMIHLFCSQKGIKDTSNGYTYHNSKFKEESEKRGLKFNQNEPCKINGWYDTDLTEGGEKVIDSFNLNLNAFAISRDSCQRIYDNELPGSKEKEPKIVKNTTRTEYECPACDMKFKGKKGLNLICGDCMEILEVDGA
jgi:hypothetical protein